LAKKSEEEMRVVMSRISAYTNASVATSSAPQIMVSLFQAALRNMRSSVGAFERGDWKGGSLLAEKAAAIVLGLQGTLKAEVAPELCSRLSELYTFVACRLGMAGVKFSPQHVREAEQVFTPIADAFVQAASMASAEAGAGVGAAR
jgi:flagellar biosynthetic protein FliS